MNNQINFLTKADIGEFWNDDLQYILKTVEENNLNIYFGIIRFAGRVTDGTNRVHFESNQQEGWTSSWSEELFGLAKSAFLHKVKVFIISRGFPYGENIIMASIYHDSDYEF